MEVFDEQRESRVPIVDHRVMVIALCEGHDHVDVVPLCRLDEAVRERSCGLFVRSHQELTLRAAPRHEIELL